MKSNLIAILLILVCLGLGAALWQQNQKHAELKKNLDQTINDYSNQVTSVEVQLEQQVHVQHHARNQTDRHRGQSVQ